MRQQLSNPSINRSSQMKVFKILYDEIVVGIVVNENDDLTDDEALSAWNDKNPSYQGDTAESAPFLAA